jgi:NADH:ubiquinone oxidoreductase subunit C
MENSMQQFDSSDKFIESMKLIYDSNNFITNIKKDRIEEIFSFMLKSGFQLIEYTAIDNIKSEGKLCLCSCFLNLSMNIRWIIKCKIKETDSVPSVNKIYPVSGWMEREIFDMFGIKFDNHPDLRRILTDNMIEGFPLRKDFNVNGNTQIRYDEELQQFVYEQVDLPQETREYNFDYELEYGIRKQI